MTLKPGAWFDHYEVLSHLGTGASQSRDCKGATTQLGSIA